jgi:hypothetical protein
MRNFSGTITYEHFFKLDLSDLTVVRVFLDLGSVYHIAEIMINGRSAGVKMWSPYIFDITDFIRKGENRLKVHVTNTPANRISKAGLISGLIGPVKIVCRKLSGT